MYFPTHLIQGIVTPCRFVGTDSGTQLLDIVLAEHPGDPLLVVDVLRIGDLSADHTLTIYHQAAGCT